MSPLSTLSDHLITTLMQQLEQQEGRIPHMYRDTRGYITIGVGHLIQNEAAACELELIYADSHLPATDETIRQEYRSLRTQPYGLRHIAADFLPYTRLILTDTAIDRLTRQHIERFGDELSILYGAQALAEMPEQVQLALFDMIFNLGMSKLQHGFPRFNHHIRNGDWASAAVESHRRGISEARNRHVHDLLSGKHYQQDTTQVAT